MQEEVKPKARLVAIVGSNRIGLSDKFGKLLATHKIPIIATKEFPDKGVSMCLVEDGNMAMLNKAVSNSIPMTRQQRRKLEKSLQNSIGKDTSKV